MNKKDTGDGATLQRLIDAAGRAGGGTVKVPAGVHLLRDALHLRDNVRIEGEPGAILQPIRRVHSALTHLVGYGHYEFQVREPEKFEVGMGVLIFDDNAFGFYMTGATITGRNGDIFYTDRPMVHDYNPARGGGVAAVFPLVSGIGISNAAVRGLALRGNEDEAPDPRCVNGCRGGGVLLLQSHGIVLERLEVARYNGDAISFQQCSDIAVRECHLHHNLGGGIHPGSGSVRYTLRKNRIEENGGCGIFYCLRTTHSLCEENEIARNKRDGISVGERDTDHILRRNTITANGGAGVFFRERLVQSGDRTRVEDNILAANGGESRAEVVISPGLSDISVEGNRIDPGEGNLALKVGEGCANIHFAGNTVGGREQTTADIAGARETVRLGSRGDFPFVGPQAAPCDAVRHLGWTGLDPLPRQGVPGIIPTEGGKKGEKFPGWKE